MAKPTEKPDWINDDDPEKITAPSGGKQALGWEKDEKPPYQFFNWFWNLVSRWIFHLDSISDILGINEAETAAEDVTITGGHIRGVDIVDAVIDNSPIGQITPAPIKATELMATSDPITNDGVGNKAFNDAKYGMIIEKHTWEDVADHIISLPGAGRYKFLFDFQWASGSAPGQGELRVQFNSLGGTIYNYTHDFYGNSDGEFNVSKGVILNNAHWVLSWAYCAFSIVEFDFVIPDIASNYAIGQWESFSAKYISNWFIKGLGGGSFDGPSAITTMKVFITPPELVTGINGKSTLIKLPR